ncbi:MAG: acyl carrier protein [Acidobacteria bacterium]|nr:acyl carrier protein [Acidobacteriota bacterium]
MPETDSNRRLQIEEAIKRLLVSDAQAEPRLLENADSGTPLIGRGIGLDSIEALRLALGLEREFDIGIPDADLTADLFRSIGTLADYIFRKTQGQPEDQQ